MRNFLNEHKVIPILNRQAGTSATTILSDPIDCAGFDSLALLLQISSTAAASGALTATFEHGETTTSFVDTTTTITVNGGAAATMGVIDIQKLTKRYARLDINPDGTDAIPLGGAVALLYNAHHEPVVQSTGAILDGMSVAKVGPTS